MGLGGIDGSTAPHEATHLDDAAGPDAGQHAPSTDNQLSAFEPGAADHAAPQPGGFDLLQALGGVISTLSGFGFIGALAQGASGGQQNGNRFELANLLSSIFDGAGQGQGSNGSQLMNETRTTGSSAKAGAGADLDAMADDVLSGEAAHANSGPDNPNLKQSYAGVRKEVEVSGQVGDENLSAQGHAKAEAHAEATSFSETYADGRNVHARAGADASVGASAQVDGVIKSKLGSIDGKAKVEGQVFARATAEAQAGADGLAAGVKAQHGVLTTATSETNLNVGNGLVTGHADAHAEAGAGGQAVAKAQVSYAPPSAVVNAKAEAFAGARAGFVAQGGSVGAKYGVGVEVWAGAGAKVELKGGITKEGKFKIDFTIGAALGVGCKINIKLDIDLKQATQFLGNLFGGGVGGLFGAVAGMFGGGQGNGAHAASAISNAAKQLGPQSQTTPPRTEQADPEPTPDAPEESHESESEPEPEADAVHQ